MAGVLAIIIGFLVIAGLVYGAISGFQRRQAGLAERAAERERTGEADELRQRHAEREAAARDD